MNASLKELRADIVNLGRMCGNGCCAQLRQVEQDRIFAVIDRLTADKADLLAALREIVAGMFGWEKEYEPLTALIARHEQAGG
jgi:hypothetical protein